MLGVNQIVVLPVSVGFSGMGRHVRGRVLVIVQRQGVLLFVMFVTMGIGWVLIRCAMSARVTVCCVVKDLCAHSVLMGIT